MLHAMGRSGLYIDPTLVCSVEIASQITLAMTAGFWGLLHLFASFWGSPRNKYGSKPMTAGFCGLLHLFASFGGSSRN